MFVGLAHRRDPHHRRTDVLPGGVPRPHRRAAHHGSSSDDHRRQPPQSSQPRRRAHGVAETRGLFDREILGQAADRRDREARPPGPGPQPRDVRRPGRLGHHLHRGDRPPRASSPGRSRSGSSSPSSSPTSPRRWPRGGARRRPTRCAGCAPRPRPAASARTAPRSAVAAGELAKGDVVVCEAGDIIPSDGEIIEGIASVDESAITGESAPVIRESGGDRSAVTGGTKVLSDRIVVRITAERGHTFLDRMIGLVEGANRQKTPNEVALTILLAALTIIFLPVVVVLQPFGHYAGRPGLGRRPRRPARLSHPDHDRGAALGHRDRRDGPSRAAQRARDERAGGGGGGRRPDAAPGQDRHDHPRQPDGVGVLPVGGHSEQERRRGRPAGLAGRRDARGALDSRSGQGAFRHPRAGRSASHKFIPFSATTRMSGLDLDGRQIRKGAADAVQALGRRAGRDRPGRTGRDRRADRPGRLDAARRRRRAAAARRHRAERHRERGDPERFDRDAARWASAPS